MVVVFAVAGVVVVFVTDDVVLVVMGVLYVG